VQGNGPARFWKANLCAFKGAAERGATHLAKNGGMGSCNEEDGKKIRSFAACAFVRDDRLGLGAEPNDHENSARSKVRVSRREPVQRVLHRLPRKEWKRKWPCGRCAEGAAGGLDHPGSAPRRKVSHRVCRRRASIWSSRRKGARIERHAHLGRTLCSPRSAEPISIATGGRRARHLRRCLAANSRPDAIHRVSSGEVTGLVQAALAPRRAGRSISLKSITQSRNTLSPPERMTADQYSFESAKNSLLFADSHEI
jgi:hypothetical protein